MSDRLVRRAGGDGRLGRASLHGTVPAEGAEAALNRRALTLAIVFVATVAVRAGATFHDSLIDELATSIGGDAHQQFVAIRILVAGQTHVTGTVLGAFDAAGAYLGDVLVLDHDVPNATGRWLLATSEFQAAQGLPADFTFPSGRLAVEAGMVCWGAPIRGGAAVDPASWNHADSSFYTDWVAYGAFCGRAPGGTAVAATPADHALVRAGGGAFDDAFACSPTMHPTNNAGATATVLGVPCTPLPATMCGDVVDGGKPRATDCWGEWLVRGATAAGSTVRCADDDPACDGSAAQGCVVRAQLCFGDFTNPRYGGRCPIVPLRAFTLHVRQRDGFDRLNVQRILFAVRSLGGAVSGTSVSLPELSATACTPIFELVVPLGQRRGRTIDGARLFRTEVLGPRRDRDRDRLKLVCRR